MRSAAPFGWPAFVAVLGAVGVFSGACGSNDTKDTFVATPDAGNDAAVEGGLPIPVDPTLGGPCTDDTQCDDAVKCTYDRCDLALMRCRNVPDDTQCDDGIYCNGAEKCVIRKGCGAGPVVTCQDEDPCTIDRCVEADHSCTHGPRDVDGDGDPDGHCAEHADCDDADPLVSSKHVEVCGNFKDDDCDGTIDEQPCSDPANDTCATAFPINAAGTYILSTLAAKKDYATSCTVKTPGAAQDIVLAITAPSGGDVEVWTTAGSGAVEVALAMQATCGVLGSETSCQHIDQVAAARAIVRNVAPGATVYAIVTTQSEIEVDARVDIRPTTPKPANETCAAPMDVATDVPFNVSIIDPAKDLVTGCAKAKTGELTYRFTLASPQDVKVFASTTQGSGTPVVSIRDASCTDELRCRFGSVPPAFARSLSAGPHVITVSGTTQLDASVVVKTYPPTAPPANASCTTAPAAPVNGTINVDLSQEEDAIPNGCLPGGPAAAYDLVLTQPSDVLVVGRFPQTEMGAVSINGPGCTTGDLLVCDKGGSPVRVSKRNLPAGDYKIVIADEQGQSATLSVFVRPTTAPTTVTAGDGCLDAFAVPAAGGFLMGDTTNTKADFDAVCDAAGQPLGGAKDQMLRFDLTAKKRVILDMTGSSYVTLLDIRKGGTCPGTEVSGGCFVGFQPKRSFLDVVLDPATYWLQIDGYAGDRGTWNLDLRVVDP